MPSKPNGLDEVKKPSARVAKQNALKLSKAQAETKEKVKKAKSKTLTGPKKIVKRKLPPDTDRSRGRAIDIVMSQNLQSAFKNPYDHTKWASSFWPGRGTLQDWFGVKSRGVILGKSQPRFCVPAEAKGPIPSKNGSAEAKMTFFAISSRGKRGKRGTKLRPW